MHMGALAHAQTHFLRLCLHAHTPAQTPLFCIMTVNRLEEKGAAGISVLIGLVAVFDGLYGTCIFTVVVSYLHHICC